VEPVIESVEPVVEMRGTTKLSESCPLAVSDVLKINFPAETASPVS